MAPLEHGATTGEEHTRNTRGSQATVGGEVDGHATGHIRVMGRGFETRRTGRWGFIIVVDTGGGLFSSQRYLTAQPSSC